MTLRRVPVADTGDAVNRVLSERQAGVADGEVDLVWVNGENFRTASRPARGCATGPSSCRTWHATDPGDPLLTTDFGTPVDGCEAPWHQAQFALVYDSDDVPDPPTSVAGLLDWAEQNPGRFTYPAPPDFTGSAFLRQALYDVSGGPGAVPTVYPAGDAEALTDPLWDRLAQVAPSLWRAGETYPRDLAQLEDLFARRPGRRSPSPTGRPPSTSWCATARSPRGPAWCRWTVGTLGNASFLAIPRNAGDAAGAMLVADLALSPSQQLAKADPQVWGQYTVLDTSRLPAEDAAGFAALPASAVVPALRGAVARRAPELSADWVAPLEAGWREQVLGR